MTTHILMPVMPGTSCLVHHSLIDSMAAWCEYLCDITDDNAGALNVGQFEQDTDILGIDRCFILWNAVIAYKRCCEDEELTRIHHGFGVFGGGEHK